MYIYGKLNPPSWVQKYTKGQGQDAAEEHLGASGAKQAKGLAKVAEKAGKGVVMSRRYDRLSPEPKTVGMPMYRTEDGKAKRIERDGEET